jgi:hypothetical protein
VNVIRPRNRAAKSGQPAGDQLSAPLSPSQKRPSVRDPLTPRYRTVNSGKPTGSIRPVIGVAGAPLPHHQPQFRSRSGRLHPHQATRGSTVTPGLDGEHRGIATASGTALRMGNLASDGTAHGATTSALAKREPSLGNTAEVSRSTARGRLRQACRVAVPLTETAETCHVPAPLEPGQGDRGLKIYRSAGV